MRLDGGEIREQRYVDPDHIGNASSGSEVADRVETEPGMQHERVVARVAGKLVVAGAL